jgi:pimeloyl-ACP methyl ester carboxylesterase
LTTAKTLNAEDREQVIEDSLRGAPPVKEAWPAYRSQEDISDPVSAITVPTLVLAAELDRVDSVATTKSELLPRIPGAVLHVVPGTGHHPIAVSSQVYNRRNLESPLSTPKPSWLVSICISRDT